MTSKRSAWLLLGCALVLGLFAQPAPAHACSCVMPDPPAPAFTHTDAVFIGTTVGAFDLKKGPSWLDELQRWLGGSVMPIVYGMGYTFSVQAAWKGVTTTEVLVHTGYGGGDCGLPFGMGQRYVIYAYQSSQGHLETNICTRTAEYSHASSDLAYLTTLPTLTLTPVVPASTPWVGFCLGGLVVGLLGLGGGVWALRQVKRK